MKSVNKGIAVVGGAGFVGTRLASFFDKANVQYNVYDIDLKKNNDKIVYLDVEDTKSLELLSSSNTIINLAAVHRDDIRPLSRYDDVNITGAKNICDAARKHKINRIIFTSSVAIYGFAPPNTDESGAPNYFNDYGRTKYLAEQVYKEWQAEDPFNRTLVIIRPTVIFGEGNRGNVYNLLNQIASKKFIMIGNGKNIKSMAYVENIVSFISYSLSFKAGLHILIYVDKPDLNMNKLVSMSRNILFNKKNIGIRLPSFFGEAMGYFADILARLINKSLPISRIRVKKFLSITQFSSSAEKTGFIAPVKLEDGLNKTLKYEFLEDNSNERTFETE